MEEEGCRSGRLGVTKIHVSATTFYLFDARFLQQIGKLKNFNTQSDFYIFRKYTFNYACTNVYKMCTCTFTNKDICETISQTMTQASWFFCPQFTVLKNHFQRLIKHCLWYCDHLTSRIVTIFINKDVRIDKEIQWLLWFFSQNHLGKETFTPQSSTSAMAK